MRHQTDNDTDPEVIPAAQAATIDLATTAKRVNKAIDTITSHEVAFEAATLDHRILIGREIAAAQAMFGIEVDQVHKLGIAARSTVPQRGTVDKMNTPAPNPIGFSGWLNREIPRLKRSTAQKYADTFRLLGLPTTATDAQVRRAIAIKLEGSPEGTRPTIAAIVKASPREKIEPVKAPPPPDTPQLRLEDAREHFWTWRERAEKLVAMGVLDDLDKPGLDDLKEFLAWMRDRINARLRTM